MKLNAFLSALGSKRGAPGGGAGAALTGAVACALIEMVSRLNDLRAGRSSGNAAKAASQRKKLQRLMDEDAKAFAAIQRSYKTRVSKPAAWSVALKKGACVPLAVARICSDASAFVVAEKPRTSRWLESDRKEAAILLRAAFEAAVLNVEINLKEMAQGTFLSQTRRKLALWRRKLQRS